MQTTLRDSLQFLRDDHVAMHLNHRALIQAIGDAFRLDRDAYVMPRRMILSQGSQTILVMPCFAEDVFGVKIVTMTQQAGYGPRVLKANYTVYSGKTGEALLAMEADALTDLRTAATSAVATQLMARPDSSVLGLFGTGRQAWAHLSVMLPVRGFTEVLVCGSSQERSEVFARAAAEKFNIFVRPVGAAVCAAESHVLCTCTTTATPLFDGSLLQPGIHVNAVGAFRPDTREVDDETMVRSRLVVDSYEGAPVEAGDILIPQANQSIGADHVLADLHEALSGKKVIRRDASDITLFKSVGCALEDLAAARLLLDTRPSPVI
jgi:ornithine cyclodeaminase/alanine dehydrogenase-like protein (mu-crystallin family)